MVSIFFDRQHLALVDLFRNIQASDPQVLIKGGMIGGTSKQ
jgi:hypothetical protein